MFEDGVEEDVIGAVGDDLMNGVCADFGLTLLRYESEQGTVWKKGVPVENTLTKYLWDLGVVDWGHDLLHGMKLPIEVAETIVKPKLSEFEFARLAISQCVLRGEQAVFWCGVLDQFARTRKHWGTPVLADTLHKTVTRFKDKAGALGYVKNVASSCAASPELWAAFFSSLAKAVGGTAGEERESFVGLIFPSLLEQFRDAKVGLSYELAEAFAAAVAVDGALALLDASTIYSVYALSQQASGGRFPATVAAFLNRREVDLRTALVIAGGGGTNATLISMCVNALSCGGGGNARPLLAACCVGRMETFGAVVPWRREDVFGMEEAQVSRFFTLADELISEGMGRACKGDRDLAAAWEQVKERL